MKIERFLEKGKIKPKRLFLIDGSGAILSAIFLGVILVQMVNLVGIPKNTLYFLASFPCVFTLYDFYCYYKVNKRIGACLKLIGVANLMYSCLSIVLAIIHIGEIKTLGWIYLLLEVVIVVSLGIIELKIATD